MSYHLYMFYLGKRISPPTLFGNSFWFRLTQWIITGLHNWVKKSHIECYGQYWDLQLQQMDKCMGTYLKAHCVKAIYRYET